MPRTGAYWSLGDSNRHSSTSESSPLRGARQDSLQAVRYSQPALKMPFRRSISLFPVLGYSGASSRDGRQELDSQEN